MCKKDYGITGDNTNSKILSVFPSALSTSVILSLMFCKKVSVVFIKCSARPPNRSDEISAIGRSESGLLGLANRTGRLTRGVGRGQSVLLLLLPISDFSKDWSLSLSFVLLIY